MAPRAVTAAAKIARAVLRGVLIFVLGVLGLVALAYAALTLTPPGRALVRDIALEQANALFRGRLAAQELAAFGLTGVALRGVQVTDPSGAQVIQADKLALELSPLALLSGEVHVDRVVVSGAQIDLADMGEERGVIAAFAPRDPAPEDPQPASEPPVVVVRSIELDEVAVSAQLPDLGTVGVAELSARGSFELRGTASAELSSLSTELMREGARIGAIESASASWAEAGQDTEVELRGRIEGTQLAIDARGRMPNDPELATAPVSAHVVLDKLEPAALRALGQAELAKQLKAPVRVELDASGTIEALEAELWLRSEAGSVRVDAELHERDRLKVRVDSDGITPGAVWEGAPAERIALELEASAQIAEAPERVPFELSMPRASFGGDPVPALRARGTFATDAVRDLVAHAQGYGVTLELSGDAGAQKLNLRGTLRARDFELAGASARALDADFTAVGPPTEPRASIALRGTALRYEQFVVDELTLEASGGPDVYDLALKAQAPEGKIDLEARAELGESSVAVDATARGSVRKRPLQVEVRGARIGFGGTIEVERAVLTGLGQRAVIEGRYGAAASDRIELDAQLDLAALSDALELAPQLQGTAELDLVASGTVERPSAELALVARQVGLHSPARERPTLDARVEAKLDAREGMLTATIEADSGDDLELHTELSARFDPRRPSWQRELLDARVEATLALDSVTSEWIGRWLAEPLPLEGRAVANASLAGTLDRPELALTARAQLRHPERSDSYELAVETRYASGAAELSATARDERGLWAEAAASLEHPAKTLQQFLAPGAALAHEARWKASLELEPRALGALPIDAFTRTELEGDAAATTVALEASVTHAPRAEPSASVKVHATKPQRGTTTVRIGLEDYECADQALELSLLGELSGGQLDVRTTLASQQQVLLDVGAGARIALAPLLRGAGPVELKSAGALVQLSDIDLGALPRLCGMAKGRVTGRIDATGLLSDSPKLTVDLDARGLSLGAPQGFDLDLQASALPDRAEVDIDIAHGETKSTLNARLPIRWRGEEFEVVHDQPIGGALDLNSFPVITLLPPSFAISQASGYLSGEVNASGTLDDPKVSGELAPERMALTVTGLAQPLHGIEGRIAFSNRKLIIERLRARDRGGSVELSGTVTLDENNDVNAELGLKADEFPIRQQGQVAGEVDATIRITAHMNEQKTRVGIEMTEASAWLEGGDTRRGISLDDHPDIIDPRAEERQRQQEEEDEDKIPPRPIEITIDAEDSFWVRREDFAVKLSTELEMVIDDGEVTVTGPIRIHRGYLQLLGQTFDIDGKSKVDLVGGSPPDPALDITAETVNRSSGKTISVHIGGRASAPELEFFVDDNKVSVGEAAQEIFGRRGQGDDSPAEGEAQSFVAGMLAGVMAMSARRELGDAMPILMIEPGDETSGGRVRAGFELDSLVPGFLEGVIRGVYLEGIFAGGSQDENSSASGVQTGVLLELYLPHDLVTSGQYGPGQTWSIDLGWEP